MPIMFCYIDPFVINQQVVKLTPGDTEVIFRGSLREISDFMATEYNNGNYDRITLKGNIADSVAEQIRNFAKLTYGLKEIKIEVLK